ncbi:hypothetical protein MXD81_09700, partial [Microbacteriaceae bacterium K1510]|nr:hypothetical protein [Microbacteriaceae bacterium K1510]
SRPGEECNAQLSCVRLHAISIVDIACDTQIDIAADPIEDRHIVQTALQGASHIDVAAQAYHLAAGRLMVSIPKRPATISYSKGSRHQAVCIPRRYLEQYLAANGLKLGRSHCGAAEFRPEVISDRQVVAAWQQVIDNIIQLATHAPDVLD